jgi:hypothetical protein
MFFIQVQRSNALLKREERLVDLGSIDARLP